MKGFVSVRSHLVLTEENCQDLVSVKKTNFVPEVKQVQLSSDAVG